MYAHSAPNLSRADICKCLSEMGIAVSETQLAPPSGETTQRVYSAFAELLAGWRGFFFFFFFFFFVFLVMLLMPLAC
jgi:hypothetical protein